MMEVLIFFFLKKNYLNICNLLRIWFWAPRPDSENGPNKRIQYGPSNKWAEQTNSIWAE